MKEELGKMPKSQTEYLLKVNLKGAKRVWRIIAIRGDQTLDDLHEAIFDAFDRYDVHMYSFYFPKAPRRRGANPARIREYTAPPMLEDPGLFSMNDSRLNAAETTLDDLHLKVGQQFEYLFDFGDSWWHDLKVEEIRPAGSAAGLPVVLEKHGQSPPQYAPGEDG